MPYSLMDYYSYRRTLSKKFIIQHIWWLGYSFYSGFIIFLMYYGCMGNYGVMGLDGQNQDLYSFGVLTIMTFVIQHHIIVFMKVRSWTLSYTFWFIVACVQLPIVFLGAENMSRSQITGAMTGFFWISGYYWMLMIVTIVLLVLPIAI